MEILEGKFKVLFLSLLKGLMKKPFILQASLPPSPQARGRKGKGDKEKEKGDKDKGEEREKKKRKIRLEMHNDQVINVMVKLIDETDEQRKKKKTGSDLIGLL